MRNVRDIVIAHRVNHQSEMFKGVIDSFALKHMACITSLFLLHDRIKKM